MHQNLNFLGNRAITEYTRSVQIRFTFRVGVAKTTTTIGEKTYKTNIPPRCRESGSTTPNIFKDYIGTVLHTNFELSISLLLPLLISHAIHRCTRSSCTTNSLVLPPPLLVHTFGKPTNSVFLLLLQKLTELNCYFVVLSSKFEFVVLHC